MIPFGAKHSVVIPQFLWILTESPTLGHCVTKRGTH